MLFLVLHSSAILPYLLCRWPSQVFFSSIHDYLRCPWLIMGFAWVLGAKECAQVHNAGILRGIDAALYMESELMSSILNRFPWDVVYQDSAAALQALH